MRFILKLHGNSFSGFQTKLGSKLLQFLVIFNVFWQPGVISAGDDQVGPYSFVPQNFERFESKMMAFLSFKPIEREKDCVGEHFPFSFGIDFHYWRRWRS